MCRHVLTGEFQSRECPNAFDCRHCETHAKLIALRPVPEAEAAEEEEEEEPEKEAEPAEEESEPADAET